MFYEDLTDERAETLKNNGVLEFEHAIIFFHSFFHSFFSFFYFLFLSVNLFYILNLFFEVLAGLVWRRFFPSLGPLLFLPGQRKIFPSAGRNFSLPKERFFSAHKNLAFRPTTVRLNAKKIYIRLLNGS